MEWMEWNGLIKAVILCVDSRAALHTEYSRGIQLPISTARPADKFRGVLNRFDRAYHTESTMSDESKIYSFLS